jgi:hypothetical protein
MSIMLSTMLSKLWEEMYIRGNIESMRTWEKCLEHTESSRTFVKHVETDRSIRKQLEVCGNTSLNVVYNA